MQRSPGMSTWYLGFDASGRRSTTPASAVPSRTRSTGTGRPSARRSRGRNGRAASTDDAGALAPRRPGIRPGSCPRPPERGGLRRRTWPRRDRARRVSTCGRTPRPTWPPSSRGSAFEFDFSPRPPTPSWLAALESAPPTPTLGAGAPTTPIRAAASSSRSSARPVALPRRAARAAAGSRGLAPRPGRAPAHLPRVRAHLDRRASGRRPARVRRPPVVAAPVGHGNVGERDRDVDVRRRRRQSGLIVSE